MTGVKVLVTPLLYSRRLLLDYHGITLYYM
jgi:hypothetical protein